MGYLKDITDQDLKKGIVKFIKTAPEIYLPGVSLDTTIFGFDSNKLKVLLLRFGNSEFFVLPGDYIKKDEDLDNAAMRILCERTGLQNIYLEQFYTSGSISRSQDPRAMEAVQQIIGKIPQAKWFGQRFITVCYYALVDTTKVNPQSQPFFTEFRWFDIMKLPKLLYDHKEIIAKALSRLQSDLDEKLIAFNLMGESFTMAELQKLYEAVHRKKFVRTNFQRKMLHLDILERREKRYSGKSHKAPYLYRFKKRG